MATSSDIESDYTYRRSASSIAYEKEYPLAGEIKEAVASVMSWCFKTLALETFTSVFPDVDQELLTTLHEEMIASLHKFMTDKIAEVFEDSQVISSLNELYTIIQNQKLVFKDVWRPSGDPSEDIKAHIHEVNEKCQTIFTEMLVDLKQENSRKLAEIGRYEQQIQTLREEISQTTAKLESAELTLAKKISDDKR